MTIVTLYRAGLAEYYTLPIEGTLTPEQKRELARGFNLASGEDCDEVYFCEAEPFRFIDSLTAHNIGTNGYINGNGDEEKL